MKNIRSILFNKQVIVKCLKNARRNSVPLPEDCVLTSRKHAVNFYVWHVVIDFSTVPETVLENRRARKREAEKKSERSTRENNLLIVPNRHARTLQFISLHHEILFSIMSSDEMQRDNFRHVFSMYVVLQYHSDHLMSH